MVLEALLDQVGGFGPAEEAEHHHAGEKHGAGVDDIFVGVFGGGAVGGFEDGVAVADVGAGGDTESANLGGAGVGDVVAGQVRSCEHGIFVGARDYLLEVGIGNAVVDHEFFLPGGLAVGRVDRVQDG